MQVVALLGVFLDELALSEPRQGRHTVARGASPGLDGPHPAFGTPLPLERERGRGEGALVHPRLAPWAKRLRPSADGLRSRTDLQLSTLPGLHYNCHAEALAK
jgi:hypothetical protein